MTQSKSMLIDAASMNASTCPVVNAMFISAMLLLAPTPSVYAQDTNQNDASRQNIDCNNESNNNYRSSHKVA